MAHESQPPMAGGIGINAAGTGGRYGAKPFVRLRAWLWWVGVCLLLCDGAAVARGEGEVLTQVAQVRRLAGGACCRVCAVKLEGVVLWVDVSEGHLIFQDDSGGMEVSVVDLTGIQAGDRVRLEGGGFAGDGKLREVLVNNDGLHSARERSEAVWLSAGRHPFQVEWFNGPTDYALEVHYAGPGLPRQRLPNSALFRMAPSALGSNLVQGLDYRCFEGDWERLPDFKRCPVTKAGTVTNLDLRVWTREQLVGLEFSGYLEIAQEGAYTFWLRSDDGSRLKVGQSGFALTLLGRGAVPAARRLVPGQEWQVAEDCRWAQAEGTLTYVHRNPYGGWQGQLSVGTNRMRLDAGAGAGNPPAALSRIRVAGIYRRGATSSGQSAARLMVAGRDQVEVLAPAPSWEPANTWATNVAQLQQLADTCGAGLIPVRLEGMVVAGDSAHGPVGIQDETGTALMGIDGGHRPLRPGDHVLLEGICTVEPGRLILGNPTLVENDGMHLLTEESGSIYLGAGRYLLHLAWFNHRAPAQLLVEYEGPGVPRQKIPATSLTHAVEAPGGAARWEPGLVWDAYEGFWERLPDFGPLVPVKEGIGAGFDPGACGRTEDVAVEFTGYLEVPREGVYTFWTSSDDGSRLYLDQALRVTVIRTNTSLPAFRWASGQPPDLDEAASWAQVEGRVSFVSEGKEAVEIELTSGSSRTRLELAEGRGCPSPLLFQSRVRALGLSQTTYTADGQKVPGVLVVPSWKQIRILDPAPARWLDVPLHPIELLLATNSVNPAGTLVRIRGRVRAQEKGRLQVEDGTGCLEVELVQPWVSSNGCPVEVLGIWNREHSATSLRWGCCREMQASLPVLTTIEQVKSLSREESQRGYPVKTHGIITSRMNRGCFVQDSTWSIYVDWPDTASLETARVGDYWDIQGVTWAEFAPNIRATRVVRRGAGLMPEPLRPTWDQLINGSLDTQYVEIQGIVTGVESNNVALLTRDGKIRVMLPELAPETVKRYRNALVRLRGCLIPERDYQTQQVQLGLMRLSNASVHLDEPAPADPFEAAPKRAADLLQFDPRAGALRRVKITGQVLHERAGEHVLWDGTNGLRFLPAGGVNLSFGDWVEVAGYPELGGPSPLLREAAVRLLRPGSLPPPRLLTESSLLDGRNDAMRVRVEARVTAASIDRSEQVVELQAGRRGFVARLENRRGWLRGVSPGSRVELTGVYVGFRREGVSSPALDSFELLLNSPADARVLERAPWWTLRHTLMVLGGMAVVLAGALFWITQLQRRVEERSRQLTVEIQRHEQTERRRALEEERSRIARDLHDDLGATLTQIRFLSALQSRDASVPEGARSHLGRISEKSRQMVASLDEIVWAVNPANDSLGSLATYLCQFAEEFFRATPIRCRLDVADRLPSTPLTSEVRHHVYLAVREALHNIAKHSRATEVWLRIQTAHDELAVAVEDDGVGFSAADSAPGDGLANMRRRLEKIGGRFECDSRPGAGTVCRLWLPLSDGVGDPPGTGKAE